MISKEQAILHIVVVGFVFHRASKVLCCYFGKVIRSSFKLLSATGVTGKRNSSLERFRTAFTANGKRENCVYVFSKT